MEKTTEKKALFSTLTILLADTYMMFFKAQNYHWNVTGNRFIELHNLFEKQYEELFRVIDDVAEIIRQLGYKVPNNMCSFANISKISLPNSDFTADQMLQDYSSDQKKIIFSLQEVLEALKNIDDFRIESVIRVYIEERIAKHSKIMWLLESSL